MSLAMRSAAAAFLFLFWAGPSDSQIVHVWDLADVDQPGQKTFYNPDQHDAQYGTPVSSADLNGDGRSDFIMSAMTGDGPTGDFRQNAGEIHVYFSDGTLNGTVDFRFPGLRTVAVYGASSDDIFGIKHASVDSDHDGLLDLMVGAFYADEASKADAGKLYILPGRLLTDMLNASDLVLDLASPLPPTVTTITGPHTKSRLGVWMDGGDVNGDGFDDVVVGADMADGRDPAFKETGRVYVYYGPLTPGLHIDASDTTAAMTIIYGIDPGDHAGSCLAVDDVDGDGFDDIVIGAGALGTLRNVYDGGGGAGDGPGNLRENAGEVVIVYGRTSMPRHVDLRTDLPIDATMVYGQATAPAADFSPDRLGEEIITADVNGDGIADLLLGAYRADGETNQRRDSGEVYLIYGSSTLPGRTIDLESIPADVTAIFGSIQGAITGDSIAAGDIHGDGYADLFIGIPGETGPSGRSRAGGIVVIAGGPDLPTRIDLFQPAVSMIWVEGADPFDFAAYWSASGDFDGDGRMDPMPNGMVADGPANLRTSTGEGYILSGAILAQHLPGVTVETDTTEVELPDRPTLGQNVPNPFNSGTLLEFQIPGGAPLRTFLRVYNTGGQVIRTLVDGTFDPGVHTTVWDGNDEKGRPAPSGLYLSVLTAGGRKDQKKLLLVR